MFGRGADKLAWAGPFSFTAMLLGVSLGPPITCWRLLRCCPWLRSERPIMQGRRRTSRVLTAPPSTASPITATPLSSGARATASAVGERRASPTTLSPASRRQTAPHSIRGLPYGEHRWPTSRLLTDQNGRVSWVWTIGGYTRPGRGLVRVRCGISVAVVSDIGIS
jgi:hypothetical protein